MHARRSREHLRHFRGSYQTTYACFLLYGIFESKLLGADGANTHAILFNVKGEDLLFLDKPNIKIKPEQEKLYAKLG